MVIEVVSDESLDRVAGAHSEVNNLRDALNRGAFTLKSIRDFSNGFFTTRRVAYRQVHGYQRRLRSHQVVVQGSPWWHVPCCHLLGDSRRCRFDTATLFLRLLAAYDVYLM